MAAITWADVIATPAPELSTVPVAAQDSILAYVNGLFALDLWGGEGSVELDRARRYMAAHFGTFELPGSGGGGAAGPVISESAGGLSRAYANLFSSGGDQLLGTTTYGRMYQLLVRQNTRLRGPFIF